VYENKNTSDRSQFTQLTSVLQIAEHKFPLYFEIYVEFFALIQIFIHLFHNFLWKPHKYVPQNCQRLALFLPFSLTDSIAQSVQQLGYGLDDQGVQLWLLVGVGDFFLSSKHPACLRITPSLLCGALRVVSPGGKTVRAWCSHFYAVFRLRMSEALSLLSHLPSWSALGQYFYCPPSLLAWRHKHDCVHDSIALGKRDRDLVCHICCP